MKPSALNSEQVTKILKAALYVGASAIIDYLIHVTTDATPFGSLTVAINIILVTIKQIYTSPK